VPDSPRIEELKRRVQSDPASIAFAALAEEYRRSERYEEAIETCKSGLVRHPSYLSAHVTLGRAFIEVGKLHEAREELEYVLKLAVGEGDRVGTVEHTFRAGLATAGDVRVSDLMTGGPTVTTRFNAAPDAAWPQTPTVERVAFDIVTTDGTGLSQHAVAVYLRRGRALLGVYFSDADDPPPAIAGQTTMAGIVNVFAGRMAQLPASVVNG